MRPREKGEGREKQCEKWIFARGVETCGQRWEGGKKTIEGDREWL
jgi:hypothetical protein